MSCRSLWRIGDGRAAGGLALIGSPDARVTADRQGAPVGGQTLARYSTSRDRPTSGWARSTDGVYEERRHGQGAPLSPPAAVLVEDDVDRVRVVETHELQRSEARDPPRELVSRLSAGFPTCAVSDRPACR